MPKKSKIQFEILSGMHPVKEAMRAARRECHEIYASRPLPEEIAALAWEKKIPSRQISTAEMEKRAGTDQHQHIGAKVTPFPIDSLSHMLKTHPHRNGAPLYILIDSVEDPRNLGALIRTAVCGGVSGVVIPRDRCAPLTPSVSRASAGALEHCAVSRVTNLTNAIKTLKKNQVWVTGLDRKGRLPVYEIDMTGPHAIVVGGEHTGIRRLVAENCDNLCHIPQFGPVNSLNASVAGAIAIFEAVRQRR